MTDQLRCPDGHPTTSTDYCDVCGLPLAPAGGDAAAQGQAPAPVPPTQAMSAGAAGADKICPNCGFEVPDDDLFCENCGYDFATGQLPGPQNLSLTGEQPVVAQGQLPDPPAPTPSNGPAAQLVWVAEVWIDPDWFATQESEEGFPSVGMPSIVPLWDTSLLVGRQSVSRNIHPQIDCGTDHGVSRRHAQLTTDGQRWWVEDLQSSNGTFVGPAGAPLPTRPVPAGQRIEFAPGDRIYVGAWTRIVVRKAT